MRVSKYGIQWVIITAIKLAHSIPPRGWPDGPGLGFMGSDFGPSQGLRFKTSWRLSTPLRPVHSEWWDTGIGPSRLIGIRISWAGDLIYKKKKILSILNCLGHFTVIEGNTIAYLII